MGATKRRPSMLIHGEKPFSLVEQNLALYSHLGNPVASLYSRKETPDQSLHQRRLRC